jgi:hypothetical protein
MLAAAVTAFLVVSVTWGTRGLSLGDFWWGLASGKVVVATEGVLTEEPFLFAPLGSGAAFLNAQWLAALVFYAAYAIGGYAGLLCLHIAAVLLTCTAVAGACHRARSLSARVVGHGSRLPRR